MAAITTYLPSTATYGAGYVGSFGAQAVYLYRRYIDVLDTGKWGVTATTWASGNTIDIDQVPLGSFLIAGGVEIIRPETVTTTATLSWGTAAAATIWSSAVASNAAAGVGTTVVTTNGTNVMVLITTATQLRITVGTAALTNCAFAVWALMAQVGQYTELT